MPENIKIPKKIINSKNFKLAFIHKSFDKDQNNERLEFLGDAVIQLAISEKLYHEEQHFNEGELTRIRAKLVNTSFLSSVCKKHAFHKYIKASKGTNSLSEHQKDKVYAGMLEAIIGAVFLETDYFYVSKFVYTLFGDELYSLDSTKDAKTVLQEYCQSNNIELPRYHSTEDNKSNEFVCTLNINNMKVEAKHVQKKISEQLAAKKALAVITK